MRTAGSILEETCINRLFWLDDVLSVDCASTAFVGLWDCWIETEFVAMEVKGRSLEKKFPITGT
jgi:hypothetical protein